MFLVRVSWREPEGKKRNEKLGGRAEERGGSERREEELESSFLS